eukprot:6185862-Pleurochrysis_carterae.AAC.4
MASTSVSSLPGLFALHHSTKRWLSVVLITRRALLKLMPTLEAAESSGLPGAEKRATAAGPYFFDKCSSRSSPVTDRIKH